MNAPDIFLFHPCVFAVDREYQIMVAVHRPCLFWIEVEGQRYCDAAAGVLRSDCATHSVRIPTEVLDKAGRYTVCYRIQIDRRPYFPVFEDTVRLEYPFKPIRSDGEIRIYHISDAHSSVDAPVKAAGYLGDQIDLLILNGDVLNHAGSPRDMQTVLLVGGAIGQGSLPIVCSRGNHDMRGILAERIHEYLPSSREGNFFYTFRLGPIWGVVLDCAEDKRDENAEYGGTIVCHEYRTAQSEMLKHIAAHAEEEHRAQGVRYRLVIAHNPFSEMHPAPFDMEWETYGEWCRILREQIKPDLMLCGHMHRIEVRDPRTRDAHLGRPCPVIIGAMPFQDGGFVGSAICLKEDTCALAFTDHTLCVRQRLEIPLNPV